MKRHINPYIGTKPLTRLKTADIQKLYNHLKESGRIRTEDGTRQSLSGTTVRGIHMVLREALDSAVREGLLPSNPADGTTLPKIVRKEKQVLRQDELETFMTILKEEPIWHDFFCTAIMTGMRQGELCGLRWDDFDEKNRTLRVVRSVDYVHHAPIIGETKTADGKRTIYLPDSLWVMLKNRKKEALSEWIFPNLTKLDAPMNPGSAYRQLKNLLQKAELPMIRFHDLRHTFASHAANSGIEPKTLAEIVGHSRASFTLDTYAHVTGDMQEDAANIVTSYITDILGKELKPWQRADEKAEQVP